MKINQSTNSGFTLIELMIVMSIVALLLALVGPLAIRNLEKAEAKSELLSIKSWIKKISYRAYIGGQGLELNFSGKRVQLKNHQQGNLIKQQQFEYLFFQPQTLNFNNKGFVSPTLITGSYRGKPLELELSVFINSNYVVKDVKN